MIVPWAASTAPSTSSYTFLDRGRFATYFHSFGVTMAILKAINPTQAAPVSPCEILKKHALKIRSIVGKKVSFAEDLNQAYDNLMMNEEECRQLWHTPYDFQKMKEHNTNFIKQAIKQDRLRADDVKSYSNIITRIYQTCCGTENDSPDSILSESDQNDFVYLVGKANTRAGLERTIVRDLTYDKRARRMEITSVVLQIQRCNLTTEKGKTPDQLMKLASETVSLPSKFFARELARALELSLR